MPVSINNTTLTFNDATTQTTSAVTSVSAGTGISVAGGKTPTITNTGVTSVTAGTGISVSASTGGVTISASGGGVTSLNGQTGAITNTTNGVIGSYVPSVNAVNIPPSTTQTFNAGDTTAGSNLRVNWNQNAFSGGGRSNPPGSGNVTAVWNSGGSSLSGTWRAMNRCQNNNGFDGESNNINAGWDPTLWVRVS